MNTDPIADLLTRIRNALLAGHRHVEIPHSKMKERIVAVLKEEGYIQSYELKQNEGQPFKVMRLILKYDKAGYPV
ncbi:MAG: 30S ribosomal protein S8, partial [Cyanobacteria bacterium HKST-UBA05]|nr:30S ribosomal protein S8 [Cyanobacteria bacterium HKST-UBA05]